MSSPAAIIAGHRGYEAGQSAAGDIFAWWTDTALPADYQAKADARGVSIHQHLAARSASDPLGTHGLLALDWMNGNRSILVDHNSPA